MARPPLDKRRKSGLKTRRQKHEKRGEYKKYKSDDRRLIRALQFIQSGGSFRDAEASTEVAKSTIESLWKQFQVHAFNMVIYTLIKVFVKIMYSRIYTYKKRGHKKAI